MYSAVHKYAITLFVHAARDARTQKKRTYTSHDENNKTDFSHSTSHNMRTFASVRRPHTHTHWSMFGI